MFQGEIKKNIIHLPSTRVAISMLQIKRRTKPDSCISTNYILFISSTPHNVTARALSFKNRNYMDSFAFLSGSTADQLNLKFRILSSFPSICPFLLLQGQSLQKVQDCLTKPANFHSVLQKISAYLTNVL